MSNTKKDEGGFWEMVRTVSWAVVIALFIRTFAYEPFNIPSGSMIPTLLVGDYLFVSKYSYGYSRYSLPFGLPLISGRILFDGPERGDVAVFKLPSDNETDYIKRIIGLPGDKVQVKEGRLYINGAQVERQRIGEFTSYGNFGRYIQSPLYDETLPNGVTHEIIEINDTSPLDNTVEFSVPKGHYFAMGDNRDNSLDSRVAAGVGFVPAVNLVGRAEVIFFSTNGSARFWEVWKWPQSIRWDRLFHGIN
ncbi:MAG: signal peptidase I [Rhodospirillaceae bacterium]|jgi:signal peptidase I|nr:signal peptidase I [Rhodospirillaceae bacterium]MBT5752261.1 signal peptidase I [Rhodospirillaceae bacterium]